MHLLRRFALLPGLIAFALLTSGLDGSRTTVAQVFTPATEMLEQDRLLGPGCNEIALSVPTQNQPLTPTQEWLDTHSTCVGDRLRATGTCYGVTDGTDQIEMCVFASIEGDGSLSVECADLVLDTEFGVFGPHPELTDGLAEQAATFSSDRNLPSALEFLPCTSPIMLSNNTFVFAAFDGLKPTTDPVVLRVNVEPGKFVAFVSDEPTISLPATQG